MAPLQQPDLNLGQLPSIARRNASFDGHWRDAATPEGYILESWSEGFMVGALIIMACITVANMRKGVILHKLILFEVCLSLSSTSYLVSPADGPSFFLLHHTEHSVSWISVAMDGTSPAPQRCCTAHGFYTTSSPGSRSDPSSSGKDRSFHPDLDLKSK